MGIVSRLRGIAWFQRFPTCSCFGYQTLQDGPVEKGCFLGNRTHKSATHFVQVTANTGEPVGSIMTSKESAPEGQLRAQGRSEQLPLCATYAVPFIPTDSYAQADQVAFNVPKQIQLSTALAGSQSPLVSTPTDSSSKSADCCPAAADYPKFAKVERAFSKKAAVAALQLTLLVVLLSVLHICSYIKAAALSCRHPLASTAAAAAPAVAGPIIASWCASMKSLTSRLYVWLATQAQRGTSSLQRQAKTYGPQLLLSLLWILALTHAFKTDPQGFTAVCSVSSLPTLASIAAHTRAVRAVRRAAAAAASHVLAAPAASLPPLLKLACAHATACLATMCKWLERPRSANFSVSLRLSSSGRQAMQSCAAHSKSTVTIVTSLVYISLSCGLMASVMTLPGLILDRCAMLLVQCWPCLLVLLAYKAQRSLDEWQTKTAGLTQASTYVPALTTAYSMRQVCTRIRLAFATVGSAASALQQKFFPDARLSQRDAELATAKCQLSKQAAELEGANSKLADKASELCAAQQQLSIQCEQICSASQGLSDRVAQLDRANHMPADKDAELDRANHMLADKDAELDRANHMLADKNAELDDANQKLSKKEAELTAVQQVFAKERAEGMSIVQTLQQQNAKAANTNNKLVEELTNTKQKLATKLFQFIKGNKELVARNSELADAKLKLASSEGLLTEMHCDLVTVHQILSQKEAELLTANQKVTKQAEKIDMLTQQQCTLSVSKPVAQSQSSESAAVSAVLSPVKDMQVTAPAQASPDSKTVTIRASDAQLLSGQALDTDCTVTSTPSDVSDAALQAVHSNPLFLSEHAQPASHLNKLSGVAPDADSTAEGPAATTEATAAPQTADCDAAAQSASRPGSEQAAEETSASEAASQLPSNQDGEETASTEAASQLQSEQDDEHASASLSASWSASQSASWSASQSASWSQEQHDAEHASASLSASQLQEQQDSDRAAAASFASTTRRIDIRLPASYTACSKAALHDFLSKPRRAAGGSSTSLLSLRTTQLASFEMEQQVRSTLGVAPDQEVTWKWKQSGYSPWVRLLAEVGGIDIGLLGKGVNGPVHYAEMLCDDGVIKACAVKTVCYTTWLERERARCELAALKAAANLPRLVQCLGVFKTGLMDGSKALIIATEYVPGLNLDQAWKVLKAELANDPDGEDKLLQAAKVVGKQVLLGLLSLHGKGRAHCDVKPDNIRVRLAADGTLADCTLVDLGGSVDYSGPFVEKPVNFQCTPWYACSVIACINSTADCGSQEHMDARAHDVHCAGCLLFFLLTGVHCFRPATSEVAGKNATAVWAAIARKHMSVVEMSCFGGVDPSSHPMLKALDEASPDRDEYEAMRKLMLGMLWPALEMRFTVEDALASELFADV